MFQTRSAPNHAELSKSTVFKKSPSVQQLREEIRKQFHEKLKIGRDKELYKRRNLFKSVVTNVHKHFSEADENLLEGGGSEALSIEEIIKVFVEVEQELCQSAQQEQVEQYAMYLEEETNALLFFVNVCSICNQTTPWKANVTDVICEQCAKLHFNSENL